MEENIVPFYIIRRTDKLYSHEVIPRISKPKVIHESVPLTENFSVISNFVFSPFLLLKKKIILFVLYCLLSAFMVTCQICCQAVEEVENLIIILLIFNGIYLIYVSQGFYFIRQKGRHPPTLL